MNSQSNEFQLPEDTTVDLNKWPTMVKAFYKSKEQYKNRLKDHKKGPQRSAQRIHYAFNRYSLLLIFQGMDAGGQQGRRHPPYHVRCQSPGMPGVQLRPSQCEKLDYDFLWRTTRAVPERAARSASSRSYCEEALIVRVHPEILHSQGLPDLLLDDQTMWPERKCTA